MRRWRVALVAVLLLVGATVGAGHIPVVGAVGAWRDAAPLRQAQTVQSLTVLADGRVLAAGAVPVAGRAPATTAELYDPRDDRWTVRTPLPFINGQGFAVPPAVTPLADGRLLYSGGQTFSRGGVFTETQLYDPLTDGWSRGAALGTARSHHAAVRLPDGTVLALGGLTKEGVYGTARTATVERYAANADRWSPVAPLLAPRADLAAIVLQDGRVLVLGGSRDGETPTTTTELYDPRTDRWTSAAPLPASVVGGTAVLVDRHVLVVTDREAARYDPLTGAWALTGPKQTTAHATVTVRGDHRVLVTGDGEAEAYDFGSGRWLREAPIGVVRTQPLAVRLLDGRVLVVGGAPRTTPPPAGPAPPPTIPTAALFSTSPESAACFAATGFCVRGRFLDYWQANGGLARNGFPLGDERIEILEDGQPYTVQYFERVRLEYHPENAPPYDVLLGQFGRRVARGVAYREEPIAGQRFFPETGHNLGGRFLDYWEANGGLAQFGLPISGEIGAELAYQQIFMVQYFERARFEYHPENADPQYQILLGQFGRQIVAENDLLAGTFRELYLGNERVRNLLGPPRAPQEMVPGATQAFEHGRMIYFGAAFTDLQLGSDTTKGRIYVLCGEPDAGRLLQPRYGPDAPFFPNTWTEGQDPGGGPGPAPGLFLPQRGFGKLWREGEGVRDCLGYATTPNEAATKLTVQSFTEGLLVSSAGDGGTIYAFYITPGSSKLGFGTSYERYTTGR